MSMDFRLSDLPDDIVIHILQRLDSSARVRFSAVCKACRDVLLKLLPLVPEPNQIPWFLSFRFYRDQTTVLLQPNSGIQENFPSIIRRELKQEGISAFSTDIKISQACPEWTMQGWVVFAFRNCIQTKEHFLYCPFTEKFIRLPVLHLFWRVIVRFAMSAPPTCSDCVFLVCTKDSCFRGARFSRIYTLRHGDKNWKKHGVPESISDSLTLSTIVFRAGSFYCLFDSGRLATFNVASESWQVLTNFLIPENNDLYGLPELVESDGDLLLVYYIDEWNRSGVGHCSVWRYNWAEKDWRRMESLGERVVFLNLERIKQCSGGFVMAATEDLEGWADRIYFSARGVGCYSLADGKFHRSCPSRKVSSHQKSGFWIMPPQCMFEAATRTQSYRT